MVVAAVLLAPLMILFLVFRVYPVIQAIRLSLDNVVSIGQSESSASGTIRSCSRTNASSMPSATTPSTPSAHFCC